jgi:hypothetical protein
MRRANAAYCLKHLIDQLDHAVKRFRGKTVITEDDLQALENALRELERR